jgi:hypothetical protein
VVHASHKKQIAGVGVAADLGRWQPFAAAAAVRGWMAVKSLGTGEAAVLDPALATPDDDTLLRSSDSGARLLVWGSWTAGLVSSLTVVLLNARNFPVYEDWKLVPALAGHQDHFLSWLWSPVNTHRVPLPRLIYLGLLELWPDFRVGMVFNILLLGLIAAAFIFYLRRLRGRTRWTDAFFPVAFLSLGNWANMGFSWLLMWVVAAALACGLLLGIVPTGELSTRRALVVCVCLVAIPLTGATALPFALLVSLALLTKLRRSRPRIRVMLIASICVSLAITAVSFVGLQHPAGIPPSPSLWATLETTAKFIALAVGPAAGAWWFVSALAVISAIVGAAVVLFRARGAGTWPLVAFLLGGFVIAVEIGNDRAGNLPQWGMLDYYPLAALPALCCAYIAYDRFAGLRWRRLGPGILCAGMVALLPINIHFGFQYRDWYHGFVDPFANEIKAGVPVDELSYHGATGAWKEALLDLRQAGIGVFSRVQDRGAIPAGRRVDGLANGTRGWSTLGGVSSAGLLEGSGLQTVLRWNYDNNGTVPVLGRSCPTPEDWRGTRAVVITLVGEGSGRTVDVRLATASGSGGVDRHDATFADDQVGTRVIAIPWDAFQHVDARGELDGGGPVSLEHVAAMAFGVSGGGRGSLVMQQIALEPGQRWGWPWSSAAGRRSLPPWR